MSSSNHEGIDGRRDKSCNDTAERGEKAMADEGAVPVPDILRIDEQLEDLLLGLCTDKTRSWLCKNTINTG